MYVGIAIVNIASITRDMAEIASLASRCAAQTGGGYRLS